MTGVSLSPYHAIISGEVKNFINFLNDSIPSSLDISGRAAMRTSMSFWNVENKRRRNYELPCALETSISQSRKKRRMKFHLLIRVGTQYKKYSRSKES